MDMQDAADIVARQLGIPEGDKVSIAAAILAGNYAKRTDLDLSKSAYLKLKKQKREERKKRLASGQVKPKCSIKKKRETTTSITEANIRKFYDSWKWKRLSYDAKVKAGRKCLCCGATPPAVTIVTDHIKPIRHHWHLRLDPTNLQVLCDDCN